MKQVFSNVAMFKKVDAIIQVILFTTLVIACLIDVAPLTYYMLTMASLQVISCLAWALFFSGDTPAYLPGRNIRRIFMIILLIATTLLLAVPDLFFFLIIAMLFIGPVCGLAYFIITLLEITFYSNARKPYYLL